MIYSFLVSNLIVLSLGIVWQIFGWYHSSNDAYKITSSKIRLQILLLWELTTTTVLHAFPIYSIQVFILLLSSSVLISLIILNIGYAEHKLHGPSIIKTLMEKVLIGFNSKIISMAKTLVPTATTKHNDNSNETNDNKIA